MHGATKPMGVTARIDPSDAMLFRRRLRGGLVLPSDAGYEAARKVWNGMVDKSPAIIVYCAGVADVVEAVGFAR